MIFTKKIWVKTKRMWNCRGAIEHRQQALDDRTSVFAEKKVFGSHCEVLYARLEAVSATREQKEHKSKCSRLRAWK